MKLINRINELFRYFCTVLLCFMTLFVIFQVVSRKFLHLSVAEVEELARYCMLWSALLGAAIGILTKSHVAVEIVRDHLPKTFQKIAIIFSHVVVLLFYFIMVYYGIILTNQAMGQLSPSMNFLKIGYIMLCVPIAGLIGILNLIAAIYAEFKGVPLAIKLDKPKAATAVADKDGKE